MAVFPYEYSTITQRGVEMGIIRTFKVDFLAQFDDVLAKRHRPNDHRLVIWDGVTMHGPDALTALFDGAMIDSEALNWSPQTFHF